MGSASRSGSSPWAGRPDRRRRGRTGPRSRQVGRFSLRGQVAVAVPVALSSSAAGGPSVVVLLVGFSFLVLRQYPIEVRSPAPSLPFAPVPDHPRFEARWRPNVATRPRAEVDLGRPASKGKLALRTAGGDGRAIERPVRVRLTLKRGAVGDLDRLFLLRCGRSADDQRQCLERCARGDRDSCGTAHGTPLLNAPPIGPRRARHEPRPEDRRTYEGRCVDRPAADPWSRAPIAFGNGRQADERTDPCNS